MPSVTPSKSAVRSVVSQTEPQPLKTGQLLFTGIIARDTVVLSLIGTWGNIC
jgi:hypothetical protein